MRAASGFLLNDAAIGYDMAVAKRRKAGSASDVDLVSRRYFDLFDYLGEMAGRPRRGWQAKVSRRLKIDPGYVSKIAKGERPSIGSGLVELAVQHVPIRREYFTAEPEALHVPPQAYMSPEPDQPLSAAVEELLAREVAFPVAALSLIAAAATATTERERADAFRSLAELVVDHSPEVVLARQILNATDQRRVREIGEALADRIKRTSLDEALRRLRRPGPSSFDVQVGDLIARQIEKIEDSESNGNKRS